MHEIVISKNKKEFQTKLEEALNRQQKRETQIIRLCSSKNSRQVQSIERALQKTMKISTTKQSLDSTRDEKMNNLLFLIDKKCKLLTS